MHQKQYDYLIVGAGLYGAVFAKQAVDKGKSVLVIDKRSHIAGNVYTERIADINVHKYGAHIFHTNNKKVWEYVNKYATFNRFTNSPVANYKGELFSLPFNMYTFNKMWGVVTPEEAMAKIEEQRKEIKGEPTNLEEQAISLVGRDIYEKLIKGYTEKQWGRDCKDLPSFIIKRLPVRLTFDNNYFNALYQGIPVGGYTKMVANMLDGVEVRLGEDYLEKKAEYDALAEKIIYTGPIDAYFDYQMGYLVIRKDDVTKIHLSGIETVMIESTSVSLTAALLCELTKKKIKVIFCDEKRNPSSELISYYGAHDTSLKVRNQIAWTDDIKKHVWTEIVAEKIRKQALHLQHWKCEEADLLYQYINEIEFGDVTNREGHAAKVYFNALFGMDFTRSAENVTNAALNYGYSLLLSTFNRCVVANGYITQLGLFHDNVFNQFNLACDLMEPFRPLVDLKVKKMAFPFFEKEEKHEMVSLLKEEVTIGNRNEYLTNAIKIYTRSVFDALNDNDVSQIKFYRTNEL